jgi:hypothetical protein
MEGAALFDDINSPAGQWFGAGSTGARYCRFHDSLLKLSFTDLTPEDAGQRDFEPSYPPAVVAAPAEIEKTVFFGAVDKGAGKVGRCVSLAGSHLNGAGEDERAIGLECTGVKVLLFVLETKPHLVWWR